MYAVSLLEALQHRYSNKGNGSIYRVMSDDPVPPREYVPVNLKREIVRLVDDAKERYGQSRDAFVSQAVIERLEKIGVRPKGK